jgi:hypothetical protein
MRVKLMAEHEKGVVPCRTRYDASQKHWLRQGGKRPPQSRTLFPRLLCV